MAIVLIGACRFTYVHLRDRFLFHGEDNFEQVIEWGKPFLVSDDYLKLLLRRDDVIPADHRLQLQYWWSTLTPIVLHGITRNPPPPWEPQEDYTHFFVQHLRSKHGAMLALAELRWLASGGIPSMESNRDIVPWTWLPVEEHKLEEELSFNRASQVESIPPTRETVDAFTAATTSLLATLTECTENFVCYEGKHFPLDLLSVMVGYTVPNDLQLVLTSNCRHLKERCHFKTTRSVYVSPAADVMDIIHAFLHVDTNELQLTATGPEGKLYDFSVLHSLPARTLPVSSCDREIRLRVQAKREYHHKCGSCYQQFRCISSSNLSRPY